LASAGERPLRGCGRPGDGPATAEVGAWSWASRLRGTSGRRVERWSARQVRCRDSLKETRQDPHRHGECNRDGRATPDGRASDRRSCRKSRAGGTLSSRLPLQRLQARLRAVRNRAVGALPPTTPRPKRAPQMCRSERRRVPGARARRVVAPPRRSSDGRRERHRKAHCPRGDASPSPHVASLRMLFAYLRHGRAPPWAFPRPPPAVTRPHRALAPSNYWTAPGRVIPAVRC